MSSPPARSSSRFRKRSRSRSYCSLYKLRRSISPMSKRKRHVGSREDPTTSKCLGIFGLSLYTTNEDLEKVFGKFSGLESCKIVTDNKTKTSRGFAFVTFSSVEDAKKAKESMSDSEVDGKTIRVDYSITRRAHTPTPGMYMGKPHMYHRRDGVYRMRRSPSPYAGVRYTITPSPSKSPSRRTRSPRHRRYQKSPLRDSDSRVRPRSPYRQNRSPGRSRYPRYSVSPRRRSRSRSQPRRRARARSRPMTSSKSRRRSWSISQNWRPEDDDRYSPVRPRSPERRRSFDKQQSHSTNQQLPQSANRQQQHSANQQRPLSIEQRLGHRHKPMDLREKLRKKELKSQL